MPIFSRSFVAPILSSLCLGAIACDDADVQPDPDAQDAGVDAQPAPAVDGVIAWGVEAENGQTIKVVDLATDAVIYTGPMGPGAALSEDATRLLASTRPCRWVDLDAAEPTEVECGLGINVVGLTPTGEVVGVEGQTVQAYDGAEWRSIGELPEDAGNYAGGGGVGPDGVTVMVATSARRDSTDEGFLVVFHPDQNRVIGLPEHYSARPPFRASDDGARIAFGCGDIVSMDACTYDLDAGELAVYPDVILGDLSADGARIVGHTHASEAEVVLFDFGAPDSKMTIVAGDVPVFSPDGESIAYRSGDTTSIEAYRSPHIRALDSGEEVLLDAETGLPAVRALLWVSGR